MRLVNRSRQIEIASDVDVADTFVTRAVGLLGKSGLERGKALWLRDGNSIHTWFMRFRIDVVFVDRELVVKAVYRDLGPWRMTWPAWGAKSVFEMPAGTLGEDTVHIGDQLYVGD